MGIMVAGLGAAAGSAAAGAVAGNKQNSMQPTVDTSGYGVDSATIVKGGKNGQGKVTTAQIDPTNALAYFQKAADTYKSESLTGLNIYNGVMQQAIDSVSGDNTASGAYLNSLVKGGSDALSEYQQMMGMMDGAGNSLSQDAINAKLAATPGYQYSVDQQQKAIARTGAATGMLNSGNTLSAAMNKANELASTNYQGYMNNLNTLNQLGANAAQFQSGSLQQLYGNQATANLNTYQGIGQAYSNAYTNSGQAAYNASAFNAQAQNDALAQIRGIRAQQQTASMNAALQAGYLNLEGQKWNYSISQDQAAAAQVANSAISADLKARGFTY